MIDALTQGVPLDTTPFPMHQLNPCLTLQTALSKTLHWVRQQVIEEQETLSALFWKPSIERCIGTMKARSGTGGQMYWHNCSYISCSYCGIITAEDGVLTLAAQEIANSFVLHDRPCHCGCAPPPQNAIGILEHSRCSHAVIAQLPRH